MIWIIVGVLVGLVVLVVVVIAGICIQHTVAESRKERNVRENGRPVLASLVMVNDTAFNPDGDPQFPGVVVFGYYQPVPQLSTQLRAVAEKLFELYSTGPLQIPNLPPLFQQLALTLKDHNYKDGRRHQVPPEIAGNLRVYFADLWIRRERLPNDWQASRRFACMASGDIEGQIILLPPDDPAAQQIYLSTDPRQAPASANLPLVPQAAVTPKHPQGGQVAPSPQPAASSDSGGKFALLAAAIGGAALLLVVGIVVVAMSLGGDNPEPDDANDNQQATADATHTNAKPREATKQPAQDLKPETRDGPTNSPNAGETNTVDTEVRPRSLVGRSPDAAGRFEPVNLQPVANAEQIEMTGIPPGMHRLAGGDFLVGQQLLQLGSSVFDEYPREIRNISVNRAAERLHFLHATQGGAYQRPGHEKHEADGTLVGRYEVHYQDGTSVAIPLVYGEHLRGWWNWDKGRPTSDAELAWTGENAQARPYNITIRLYHFAWENPQPAKRIASIDFVSAGAKAAPFCVAISVQGEG